MTYGIWLETWRASLASKFQWACHSFPFCRVQQTQVDERQSRWLSRVPIKTISLERKEGTKPLRAPLFRLLPLRLTAALRSPSQICEVCCHRKPRISSFESYSNVP